MTFKAQVMSDRSDEYMGKKGVVKQQVITVMDVSDTGERLAQPIEYAMSDEEKAPCRVLIELWRIDIAMLELLVLNQSEGKAKIQME